MPEDEFSPEWANNKNWTEFDWELALRQSDTFAAKYFDLLQKYGELPGSDDIILQKLDGDAPTLMDDGDYYIEFDPEELADIDEEDGEIFEGGFFYENAPSFMLLRQVSIGWCNIYATFLSPEHRKYGVTILFHLGRGLAHLIGSLGDGSYEPPASHLASAKRALDQINKAIGLVDLLTSKKMAYKKVTTAINKHLVEAQEKIIDHIYLLKTKQQKP
jgi:hypothetical protein